MYIYVYIYVYIFVYIYVYICIYIIKLKSQVQNISYISSINKKSKKCFT